MATESLSASHAVITGPAVKVGPVFSPPPTKRKRRQTQSQLANLRLWKAGQSGNPSGRPPLPKSQRERQKILREAIQELAPKAIEVIQEVLNSNNAAHRDKIRAAEIMIANSVPKQEEMIEDATTDNPFVGLPPSQLQTLIQLITAGGDTPQVIGSVGPKTRE